MPDDILDAAQKAIDEASKNVTSAPSDADSGEVPSPAPETPVASPLPTAPSSSEPTRADLPPEPPPEPIISPPVSLPTPQPPSPDKSKIPGITEETSSPEASKFVNSILETRNPEPVVPPPPPQSKHQKPKGKTPAKGIILGILAILLLTLPVSVFFISRQNQQIADIRSSAYASGCDFNDANACPDSSGVPHPENCHCQHGDQCDIRVCEPDTAAWCIALNQNRWCKNWQGTGMTCCEEGYSCCVTTKGCCGGGNPTRQPTNPHNPTDTPRTPTRTPTPTTGTEPVCQNIKIYKGGTQVTPSTLHTGDEVVLAVKGNLPGTKARFRINGGSWTETTNKNASDEYILNYTIPSGITDFVIEGEVFIQGAWH